MQDDPIVPYGYCHCGCGEKTKLAPQNSTANGWTRGEPMRWVNGHNGRKYRGPDWIAEDRGYQTPCHISQRAPDQNGYARRRVGTKIILEHRFAWIEVHGPIPDGLDVCHRCDVPACRNVEHLFVGTRTDNMRDCVTKGRHGAYVGMPRAKLTPEDVREIRAATGVTHRELAQRYPVGDRAISKIRRGERWANV